MYSYHELKKRKNEPKAWSHVCKPVSNVNSDSLSGGCDILLAFS